MEKDNQIQVIGAATGLRRRASDFVPVSPPGSAEGWLASWRVIRKRRWSVILAMGAVFFAIAIWTLRQEPMYEAKGTLEIAHESPGIVTVQELFNAGDTGNDYLETQYKILQSDSLAREVIAELHLDRRKEFSGRESEDSLAEIVRLRVRKGEGLRTDAARAQSVLEHFENQLSVEPIPRSRLVRVMFDSEDPQLAAKVVNTLVQCYIQSDLRVHSDAARKASSLLSGQLEDVKRKLEESEGALQQYANANGLVYLEGSGGDAESIVDQRLRELQEELTQAQSDRYQKEALFRLSEAGDYGALPGVFDNKVMQDLVDRLADLEKQEAALAPEFKPDYPKRVEIQSQIDRTEDFLQQQRQEAARHIADEYFAAIHREDLVSAAFSAEEKNASAVARKAVQYDILKRDVDTNEQIYDGLLQHLKEAGVSSALGANDLRVIDAAVPPASPAKPHIALNLAFGLLLGLASGAAVAVVQERANNTLKSPEDVEQSLRIAVLGMIPLESLRAAQEKLQGNPAGAGVLSEPRELMARPQNGGRWLRTNNGSPERREIREAFRALRTSVLLTAAGRPPRSLAVTSAEAGEGKTTVCCNLAISLANLGKRVLVIDADIRKAGVQDFFGLNGSSGLVNYLAGEGEWRKYVQAANVKGLDCLICGPEAPNPGELLSSERMRDLISDAMSDYNFIVVDSPPLLNLADGRIVASVAEGTILVVKGGGTSRGKIQRAQAYAANAGARIIGVALNGMDPRNTIYGDLRSDVRQRHGSARAREKLEGEARNLGVRL